MPVVSTHKDVQALTVTFVAEFDADVERVWQVWQDPRQLEQWWGPPTWPATFERHDVVVGGTHLTVVGKFGSTEHMEQVMAMGAEEGMRSAMGQIDGLLAAS